MLRSVLLSVFSAAALASAAPQPQPFDRPLVFEPNYGQAPSNVKWIARASGYQFLLTNEGATMVFREASPADNVKPSYSTVQMKLLGGRRLGNIEGVTPTGGVSNYLLGNDPRNWHIGIPHYTTIRAASVYEGVDLVFYGKGSDLEYDFVVAPGADPKQIRLAFNGVDGMRIDRASGDLLLRTAAGSELRHGRPKVYQEIGGKQYEIAGGYEILDQGHATFALANYDGRHSLVIDPSVKFTTFLAGSSADGATSIAADSAGNSYVTGSTSSTNFPQVGSMQNKQPGPDVFVTKLSSTGGILFSTYLGGSGRDIAWGIAVDSTGIFIAGDTDSANFPIHDSIFPNRSFDAFVTKISPAGNSLIYSSYLGGSQFDFASGIAIDAAHTAWVVGTTASSDFPIRGGPSAGQQPMFGGVRDAFLARIAADGLSVAFSTFAGGPGDDQGYDVVVDRTGSVYATGFGASSFPTTAGLKPCGSSGGAFVIRRKGPGTQSVYSTCLPAAQGSGITVDANFNAYVTGLAYDNFQTTPGSFQPIKPTPRFSVNYAGFVAKLDTNAAIVYSTFLGGTTGYTYGADIAISDTGAAYVAGATSSTDFPGVAPLVPNPSAGFVSKLTPEGNGLNYTVRLGASVQGVAFIKPIGKLSRFVSGRIYTSGDRYTGGTTSDKTDAFVVKLEESSIIRR